MKKIYEIYVNIDNGIDTWSESIGSTFDNEDNAIEFLNSLRENKELLAEFIEEDISMVTDINYDEWEEDENNFYKVIQ